MSTSGESDRFSETDPEQDKQVAAEQTDDRRVAPTQVGAYEMASSPVTSQPT